MPDAKSRILGRLHASPSGAIPDAAPAIPAPVWTAEEGLARVREMMAAVHGEFLDARGQSWPQLLCRFLEGEGLTRLVYAPQTPAGARLASEWPAETALSPIPYDRPFEEMKPVLFDGCDAALTQTRGAIVETGSLILWPSAEEPRTLSLVPPVHLALLEVDKLYPTFLGAMRAQGWAGGMPTNALLISGPSKTADIEQTLAYGVHGPKRLVVVLIDSV